MNYRKRPIVIQAELFDRDKQHRMSPEFRAAIYQTNPDFGPGDFRIKTLEGDLHLSAGDWIIKGVKGEFYPCKPDIFNATYEAVP